MRCNYFLDPERQVSRDDRSRLGMRLSKLLSGLEP